MYSVSVVIPIYNEEENIGRCLESVVLSIDYLKSYYDTTCNIIVVDDGSTDNSKEIAERYRYVTVITGEHKGVATARHIGTTYSTNDIIVSTDADVIVPEDWLTKIYTHFYNDEKLIAVSGNYKEMYGRFFETLAIYNANFLFHGMGGNTAFKKDAYTISGGYDTSISYRGGTDIRLWNKLGNMGKTIHDSNIYVLHDSGYRWRATTVYSISITLVLLGNMFSSPLLKITGSGLAGYELVTHSDKLLNKKKNRNWY